MPVPGVLVSFLELHFLGKMNALNYTKISLSKSAKEREIFVIVCGICQSRTTSKLPSQKSIENPTQMLPKNKAWLKVSITLVHPGCTWVSSHRSVVLKTSVHYTYFLLILEAYTHAQNKLIFYSNVFAVL